MKDGPPVASNGQEQQQRAEEDTEAEQAPTDLDHRNVMGQIPFCDIFLRA
jgi:hypothetical protein